MPMTLSHCFLYVLDQDEALRFYTEGLGLEVRTDVRMGDYRWLTVGPPDQPDMELGLADIGPPLPPEDHATVRELVAKGSMGAVIFAVDEAISLHDIRGVTMRVVFRAIVEYGALIEYTHVAP